MKIEISCLSMREPYEVKPVFSLVEQINSSMFGESVDDDFSQEIKTVSPARTFLEKAFLLAEEFMKDNPRTSRMSRRLYDMEKLSYTAEDPEYGTITASWETSLSADGKAENYKGFTPSGTVVMENIM